MKRIFAAIFSVIILQFLSGCTTTMGMIGDKSHFTYPNSNVEPLGTVSAEVSKTSFLIPKSFDKEDIRQLFNQALIQKAGADVLINYRIDTKFTTIPVIPLIFSTVTISGTAAKMTVGQKELLELKSTY